MAATGGLLSKVVSIPIGLYVASVLGPSGFGTLALVLTIVQYMSYANLGFLSNLVREVPMAYGRDDIVSVERVYGVVAFNFFISTLIVLGVFWVIFSLSDGLTGLTVNHAVLLTLIVLCGNVESFLYSAMKGEGRFELYGRYELLRPFFVPIANAVLVWAFGLTGMIASHVVIHFLGLTFLIYFLRLPRIRFRADLAETRRLMSTGMKIYFNKILDGLLVSTAVLLGLIFLKPAEVGLLVFAVNSISAGRVPFATLFSVTVDRKIMLIAGAIEDRAERAASFEGFRRFFGTPFAVYFLWISFFIGTITLFFGYAVQVFLLDFRRASVFLAVLYVGVTVYSARSFALSFINGIGKMERSSRALLVGIATNIVLCLFALGLELGAFGLAMALSVSMVIVSIQMLSFALTELFGSVATSRAELVRIGGLAVGLGLVVAALIHAPLLAASAVGGSTDLAVWVVRVSDLGLRLIIFLVICYVGFALAFRDVGLHAEVRALLQFLIHRFKEWKWSSK